MAIKKMTISVFTEIAGLGDDTIWCPSYNGCNARTCTRRLLGAHVARKLLQNANISEDQRGHVANHKSAFWRPGRHVM